MKYLVNFSKKDRMVYISHLDLQRMLLRALRMAGLRPEYTQGFHPHAKLSIALPLSLGYASDNEYFEFEIAREIDALEAAEALNAVLPAGIRIKKILPKPEGTSKSLAALTDAVTYEIMALYEPADIQSIMDGVSIARAASKWRDERVSEFFPARIWGNKLLFSITLKAEGGNAPNPVKLLADFLEKHALTVLLVKRTNISIPAINNNN